MKLLAFLLAALLPSLAANSDVNKWKMLGSATAPIRVEVFSDFECPACKAFHETVLPMLIRDYVLPGKISIVSREFPLPIAEHKYSREVAEWATAAARVGKYSQVADVMFRNQTTWAADGKWRETMATVLTPAEQKKVEALVKDPAIKAEVQRDIDDGHQLRINSTPTLVIWHGAKNYVFPGPNLNNYGLLRSLLDGIK